MKGPINRCVEFILNSPNDYHNRINETNNTVTQNSPGNRSI